MLFHTSQILANSKSQSYWRILDNQEYTAPTQSFRKKLYPAFLGDKIFTENGNGNRPLDGNVGRVIIKIVHSLSAQFKMRCNATVHQACF